MLQRSIRRTLLQTFSGLWIRATVKVSAASPWGRVHELLPVKLVWCGSRLQSIASPDGLSANGYHATRVLLPARSFLATDAKSTPSSPKSCSMAHDQSRCLRLAVQQREWPSGVRGRPVRWILGISEWFLRCREFVSSWHEFDTHHDHAAGKSCECDSSRPLGDWSPRITDSARG